MRETSRRKTGSFTMTAINQISGWTETQIHRWLDPLAMKGTAWAERNKTVFAILMLLQIAAYSYFYTSIVLTDHTLPQARIQPFPSNLTFLLGRWMSDLVIQALGGSGVQSFQMLCATTLQAVNGILLAEFIGLRRKREILCVAALLCMYPAFLDYYSFMGDMFSLVVGDSFAICGILVFGKNMALQARVGGAAFFFLLAIACHQPKIALVSFLAACSVLVPLVGEPRGTIGSLSPSRKAIRDGIAVIVAIAIAMIFCWLSAKVFISSEKLATYSVDHVNTPAEALQQIGVSHRRVFSRLTRNLPGLPGRLRYLPAIGVVGGVTVVLWQSWKKGMTTLVVAIGVVSLMPIAMRASHVVNFHSQENLGRMFFVSGYCLAFFIGCGFLMKGMRALSAVVGIVCFYFFAIHATQESNYAAYKMIYETSMIGRIVARAEEVLESPLQSKPKGLVVVGCYPRFQRNPYVKNPGIANYARTHVDLLSQEARQVELMNFYSGRNVFRQPTQDEASRAIESTKDKTPWPSSESIYLLEDTLVVFLERSRPVTSGKPANAPISPPSPAVPPTAP